LKASTAPMSGFRVPARIARANSERATVARVSREIAPSATKVIHHGWRHERDVECLAVLDPLPERGGQPVLHDEFVLRRGLELRRQVFDHGLQPVRTQDGDVVGRCSARQMRQDEKCERGDRGDDTAGVS